MQNYQLTCVKETSSNSINKNAFLVKPRILKPFSIYFAKMIVRIVCYIYYRCLDCLFMPRYDEQVLGCPVCVSHDVMKEGFQLTRMSKSVVTMIK